MAASGLLHCKQQRARPVNWLPLGSWILLPGHYKVMVVCNQRQDFNFLGLKRAICKTLKQPGEGMDPGMGSMPSTVLRMVGRGLNPGMGIIPFPNPHLASFFRLAGRPYYQLRFRGHSRRIDAKSLPSSELSLCQPFV